MYRFPAFVLFLFLLCPMICMPVAAATAVTVTLHVGTQTQVLTEDVLPAPAAPAGKVFAGWTAEGVFLPAGAAYTGESDIHLTALFVGMSTQADATVRTNIKAGIRFLTQIDRADLTALETHTQVTYGTYIAPASYVEAADGVLTPAALVEAGKTKYLDVQAKKFYAETDTVLTVAGSVVDILSENYYSAFMGAGYIKISYTNGSSGAIIAPPSQGVKLYDLAVDAYSDRTANADATHVNATAHGTYSPYGSDHLTYFAQVMDCVVDIARFQVGGYAENYSITPVFYGYQPISYTISYDLTTAELVFTVKEGSSYLFNKDLGAVYLVKNGQVKLASGNEYDVSANGRTLSFTHITDFTPNA